MAAYGLMPRFTRIFGKVFGERPSGSWERGEHPAKETAFWEAGWSVPTIVRHQRFERFPAT